MSVKISRREFWEALLYAFNEEDTRSLCSMALGMEYDDLPGDGLAAKQRELIAYFERRERNGELISAVSRERPRLLTLDTGRLGPLLGVPGEFPDPVDRVSFHTEMARREVRGEVANRAVLVALVALVFLELARIGILVF
jgi:hypothetical protein